MTMASTLSGSATKMTPFQKINERPPYSFLSSSPLGVYANMEKVHKFEDFVDRRLKPDLVHAVGERDKVLEQQKIFSDLKKNIELLEKNGLAHLRTMVNLGSEVYVQADVPDTRHIFVDIGLGFHVEFTWSEALQFISTKEKALSRQVDEHTRQIANIKAQIKLVCEGIRELLNIPADGHDSARKH